MCIRHPSTLANGRTMSALHQHPGPNTCPSSQLWQLYDPEWEQRVEDCLWKQRFLAPVNPTEPASLAPYSGRREPRLTPLISTNSICHSALGWNTFVYLSTSPYKTSVGNDNGGNRDTPSVADEFHYNANQEHILHQGQRFGIPIHHPYTVFPCSNHISIMSNVTCPC